MRMREFQKAHPRGSVSQVESASLLIIQAVSALPDGGEERATTTGDVPSGSKLTVAWISVDSGGAAPANYKIDEVSFDVGMIDNHVDASLSKPNNGWPVGTYQVEIIVDGTVEETVPFAVK